MIRPAVLVALVVLTAACSADAEADPVTTSTTEADPVTTSTTDRTTVSTTPPAGQLLTFHAVLDEVDPPCDDVGAAPGQLVVGEPSAEAPVRCLVLGPAAADETVLATALIDPTLPGLDDGDVGVIVEFDDAGSAALDELAAAQLDRRVAVLVAGELVVAPIVQQASFGGGAVIAPLEPDAAQLLVSAVRG